MTTVELVLPEQVVVEAGLAGHGTRGGDIVSIVMDGIDVTANLISLAVVAAQIPALAAAIRRWVSRTQAPTTLTLKGRRSSFTLDLPPNVSAAKVAAVIEEFVESERDSG